MLNLLSTAKLLASSLTGAKTEVGKIEVGPVKDRKIEVGPVKG